MRGLPRDWSCDMHLCHTLAPFVASWDIRQVDHTGRVCCYFCI
jgi:hypothetical protein